MSQQVSAQHFRSHVSLGIETVGPATENARRPYMLSQYHGRKQCQKLACSLQWMTSLSCWTMSEWVSITLRPAQHITGHFGDWTTSCWNKQSSNYDDVMYSFIWDLRQLQDWKFSSPAEGWSVSENEMQDASLIDNFHNVNHWTACRSTENICSVTIVWSIRGKIIRTVQCCTVYYSCTYWRQPRRDAGDTSPLLFWLGGTSVGISPPILLHTFR